MSGACSSSSFLLWCLSSGSSGVAGGSVSVKEIFMRPIKIEVPQARLDAIHTRGKEYEWHEMPRADGLDGTWAYGANLDFLRELCVYWGDQYDWRKWEAELNR